MKNKLFLSFILGAMPLAMMAQDDDMYFVPTKKNVEKEMANYGIPRSTYYSGSNRSVDDYNRRGGGSYYQIIPTDTTGNDIIDFSAERGVYPDSTVAAEDFALTRQMERYDGYEPDAAYREGYRDGRRDSWGWHSPWFYSSYYPWYDSYWYWNDPWYYRHYGWYGSWYDPWYYDYYWYRPYGWYGGYYSYYRPYRYYGGGGYYSGGASKARRYERIVQSSPRGISNGRTTTHSSGTFGGSSVRNRTIVRSNGYSQGNTGVSTNSYGNFGSNRSMGSSSSSSSGSFGTSRSSSSGSFGGGGGGFGGSHTVGGSRSSRR